MLPRTRLALHMKIQEVVFGRVNDRLFVADPVMKPGQSPNRPSCIPHQRPAVSTATAAKITTDTSTAISRTAYTRQLTETGASIRMADDAQDRYHYGAEGMQTSVNRTSR